MKLPARHLRNILHVVVYGGNGFVGRHIVQKLSSFGNIRIWAYDLREFEDFIDTEGAVSIVEQVTGTADSEIASGFLPGRQADIIIYCAGHEFSQVGLNSKVYQDVRAVAGLLRVLEGVETMVALNKGRFEPLFVYVSSWTIYGDPTSGRPFNETDSLMPVGHGGKCKLLAEDLVTRYCEKIGIPLLILRPSELWGRRTHNEQMKPGFFPGYYFHILNEVCKQPDKIVVYDPDMLIDLCSVDFLSDSLLRMLQEKVTGIYNISSGEPMPLSRVVEMVVKSHGDFKGEISYDRTFEIPDMLVSSDKLFKYLGHGYSAEKYDLAKFTDAFIKIRRYEIAKNMTVERAMSENVMLDMTAKGALEAYERRKLTRMLDYSKIMQIAGDEFKKIDIGSLQQRAKDLGLVDEDGKAIPFEQVVIQSNLPELEKEFTTVVSKTPDLFKSELEPVSKVQKKSSKPKKKK